MKNIPCPRLSCALAAAMAVLVLASFCASSAYAANFTWVNSGATNMNDSASWSSISAGTPFSPASGVAYFVGPEVSQPNLTVSATTTGLNFSGSTSYGYDITASNGAVLNLGASGIAFSASSSPLAVNTIDAPINMTASQSWTNTAGGQLVVNGNITSNSAVVLTLSGAGANGLVLNGNSSYSGTTTFGSANNSNIGIGSATAFGTSIIDTTTSKNPSFQSTVPLIGANKIMNNFNVNGSFGIGAGSANIEFGGNLNLGGTSRTITCNSANLTIFSGVISNDGGAGVIFGGVAVSVLGANTYTGPTALGATLVTVSSIGSAATAGGLGQTDLPMTVNFGNGNASGGLIYTGAGETCNRSFTLIGAQGTFTFDMSGTGLLNYTTTLSGTSNTGAGAKNIALQGSTSGTGQWSGNISNGTGTQALQITKNGTGTWILSGSNSYSQATTVNGGVLVMNSANALSGSSNLRLNGGVVGLGGGDFAWGLGTTGSTVEWLGSGGFAAYGANRNVNIGGASATLIWTRSFFVPDGSALILGAAGADHTIIFQNPIQLLYTGVTTPTRTIQVIAGTGGVDANLTGVISNGANTSSLIKSGNGTLQLSATNTYTGTTLVSNGTLILGNNLALQNSAIDTSGTGVISLVGTNPTFGGLADGAGQHALASVITTGYSSVTGITLNPATGLTYSYSGVIANSAAGMTLTKTGAGTQVLSGPNTYSGLTTVSAGVLQFSSANNLGNSSLTNSISLGAATLESTANSYDLGVNRSIALTGAGTILSDLGTLTVSGSITNGANLLTVGGAGNTIISGVIGNGSGALTKSGAGTLTLSNANTYTGVTTLSSGTLNLSNQNAAQFSSMTMGGGTLVFDSSVSGHAFTVAGLAATSSGAGYDIALQDNTSPTPIGVALTVGATTNAYAGVLSGSGSLIKAGSGAQTLSGANSYTGGTTINNGTLKLDFSAAGAPTNNILNSTGTLNMFGGTFSLLGKATTAPIQTLAATTLNAGDSTLVIKTGSSSTSITGSMGAIVRNPGSVLTFSPNTAWTTTSSLTEIVRTTGVTYDGVTYGLPASGQWSYVGAGFVTGATTNARYVQIDSTGQFALASSTANWVAAVGDSTKVYIASANSTMTGSASMYGIYGSSNANVLKNLGGYTLTTNGILNYNTARLTMGSGTVQIGSENDLVLTVSTTGTINMTATIVNNGANTSAVTVNSLSTGNVTLAAANTYSGPTYLDAGTLFLSNQNAVQNSTLTMQGGTVVFDGAVGGSFNAGGLAAVASGAGYDILLTDTSSNPVALSVGSNNANTTYAGVLSGAGSLMKTGSGTLTLSAASNYAGTTTVNAGTLVVSGSLTATSAVSVAAGTLQADGLVNTGATTTVSGTLNGNGTVGTVSVQNGGTLAPGHGPGRLTVTNGLGFSGSGASLSIVINNTTAGTGYSQVKVTGGSVTLNNATLSLTSNFTPTVVIGDLADSSRIYITLGGYSSGTFGNTTSINDPAYGAQANLNYVTASNGSVWAVFYGANSSNGQLSGGSDIALYAIPEPQTWVMLFSGFGVLLGIQRLRLNRVGTR